jgi:type II secretory pathway pseudopilin PulG
VNEELVNYLTGKLNYIDLFLKNNAGKTGHGILDDHKKRIDDEQAKPDYNRTKTPAEMATDAAQKISYVSLITTLDAIHKKEEDSAKAKVQSSVKAAVEKQQKVLDAATERNRIETLKNVLIKYINDNFKETYLVFIDATMRSTDKKWESLSKTCYRAMVKPNTCDNVKYITDLQSKKTALYTQIINYYKATGEWMSFEYIVKDVVLKGVKNLIDEKKTNIMDKIKDDIKKSEAELSAANRRADIDNVASYIPFKIGSSRRSKKRSASKTRKQKK